MSSRPVVTRTPSALADEFVPLPDPPEPEDMNNWRYFNSYGHGLHLIEHLGSQATTLITSEVYLCPEHDSPLEGRLVPDLLVAFNIDPELAARRNGYVISDHGKPPDFVLEIGSSSTGHRDATDKRTGYAKLGVREYWRFDPSGGSYQGVPLAGDRLVGGAYEPIPVERIDGSTFQGYSPVLDLRLRWEQGQLGWYDPATGRHILTYHDQQARADVAEAHADAERAFRLAAEARVRELEAELERRRQS